MKPGAAQCRFVALQPRVSRLADGVSALAGVGSPVDHHGKVLLRISSNWAAVMSSNRWTRAQSGIAEQHVHQAQRFGGWR